MQVKIGLLDILLGHRRSEGGSCMVERALRRQATHLEDVHVGFFAAHATFQGRRIQIQLPKWMAKRIEFFDFTHLGLPFSFDLGSCPVELIPQPTLAQTLRELESQAA